MNTEQIKEIVEAGNFLAFNPLGRTPGAVARWTRATNALDAYPKHALADPETDIPELEAVEGLFAGIDRPVGPGVES